MEGHGGQMKTLGLTEDLTSLLCMPENDQSKKIYLRHQNHFLQYIKGTTEQLYN